MFLVSGANDFISRALYPDFLSFGCLVIHAVRHFLNEEKTILSERDNRGCGLPTQR